MANDYVLDRSTVDRAEAPARFEKPLKIFIILAALCLGGELIWLLGISPFRPFTRIDVTGIEGVLKEEILMAAGIDSTSSYFSVDVREIENALLGISSIESARVFKHYPGRLQIILESRKAVASALASLNGQTVPVLFDSQGVIFEIGGPEIPSFLPVVSGLVIEEPVPGMRLPGLIIPFLQELESIEISSPELLSAVSELRIERKPYDGFDLVLYPIHKKIKVRLSELNEDLLRYTLLMVDVLSSRENEIDILDFRSGIASYIPKEAYSE